MISYWTLQWFLEDEADRMYSLSVLASLAENRAVVPILWFYEVGNGLLMALRRKRVSLEQVEDFLARLKALPIEAARQSPSEILELPVFAKDHGLTNHDGAYLVLAKSSALPLATTDRELRRASAEVGVNLLSI